MWGVKIQERMFKTLWRKLIFEVPDSHLFLRAWMTFKKAEMDKTLKNGLSNGSP